MSALEEIEARAASKAINETVRMFEDAFGVQAKGSKPTAKRKSVIRALEKKFDQLRKRPKRRAQGPIVSKFVSKITKAAASEEGLRLDP